MKKLLLLGLLGVGVIKAENSQEFDVKNFVAEQMVSNCHRALEGAVDIDSPDAAEIEFLQNIERLADKIVEGMNSESYKQRVGEIDNFADSVAKGEAVKTLWSLDSLTAQDYQLLHKIVHTELENLGMDRNPNDEPSDWYICFHWSLYCAVAHKLGVFNKQEKKYFAKNKKSIGLRWIPFLCTTMEKNKYKQIMSRMYKAVESSRDEKMQFLPLTAWLHCQLVLCSCLPDAEDTNKKMMLGGVKHLMALDVAALQQLAAERS